MISEIFIDGMHCMHCVKSVNDALCKTDGVISVDVSLDDKKASVEYDETKTNVTALIDAIEAQGFDVRA